MMRFYSHPTVALLILTATTMVCSNENAEAFSSPNEGGQIPQLPPPEPNSNIPSIKLGETIRFEEYGPIILNTDGTTRRISNWDTLTDKEKEVSWRRISKRNEERRLVLLEQQKQKEAQGTENEKEL